MERVVVTGYGIISSIGCGPEIFINNIMQGASGVIKNQINFCGKVFSMLCAPVLEYRNQGNEKILQLTDNVMKDAINMSRILHNNCEQDNTGLLIATATGCIPYYEEIYRSMLKSEEEFAEPCILQPYHGIAEHLRQNSEIKFIEATTFNNACASSNLAIACATRMIRNGKLDRAVIVGAEALSDFDMLGFNSLGILSKKGISPFDNDRDGTLLGEGAGALVLESFKVAKQRKAPVQAEITGFGISNEAYQLATPDPKGGGAVRCMQAALADAKLGKEQIDYINAHGTGTVLNDAMETLAIKTVFEENAYRLSVSSSKSMLGHTRGASGVLEAIICILALQKQQLPPTINYKNMDSQCDLDYIPNHSRSANVSHVLSNTFGFGGHCASIIFSRI